MSGRTYVSAKINGEQVDFLCEPRQSLLEVLRDELGMTGSKEGCNNGNCGACNVILNGALVNSCCVLGVEAQGAEIATIEGVANGDELHPLQTSFLEDAALQCGICTPGFIVAAKALLDNEPDADEARIRHWLAGNLCRCTGYDKIVRAVLDAAAEMRRAPAKRLGQKERTMVTESKPKYKVIGTRPIRPDGIDKVTGRAQYGADIRLQGALHGRMKRSPHAHAVIKRIDASKALALDGVKAVVTGQDLCARRRRVEAVRMRRRTSSPARKVLYRGHAVAAVAAINDQIAQEAVEAHRGRVRGAAARARRARGDAPRRADPARGAADARAQPERRAHATSSRTRSRRSATSRRASRSATSSSSTSSRPRWSTRATSSRRRRQHRGRPTAS